MDRASAGTALNFSSGANVCEIVFRLLLIIAGCSFKVVANAQIIRVDFREELAFPLRHAPSRLLLRLLHFLLAGLLGF